MEIVETMMRDILYVYTRRLEASRSYRYRGNKTACEAFISRSKSVIEF